MNTVRVLLLMILLPLAALAQTQAPAAKNRATVPEISGPGGDCSVNFRVTDAKGKPIYDAKVEATIRHGLMSQRKEELEVHTNAEGRARVVGLPDHLRAFVFSIRYGSTRVNRMWSPNMDCDGNMDITLNISSAKNREIIVAPEKPAPPAASSAPAAPASAPAPVTSAPAAPPSPTAPAPSGRATPAPASSRPAEALASAPAAPTAPAPAAAPKSRVTEISTGMGGKCSIEFHVTDGKGKGVYDAKVSTSIRYGFMSQRHMELEAGTNADGRARFLNLPQELKPVEFTITYGGEKVRRTWTPIYDDCLMVFEVPLRKQ